MKSKLGLVLEGGGAKGSYHLGVYKALMEMGYKFDGVAGTSIGAINGALIAQGEWKKAYDMWYNASNHIAFGVDEEAIESIKKMEITPENARYAASLLTDTIKHGGIKIDGMKDLFFSVLNEKKLRRSKMELGIVTIKLPDFKTIELFKDEIKQGEIQSYLLASANFPLFKREENEDGMFIDGGLKNNLPLNMLPKRGIKDLIAVRTFGVGFTRDYNDPDVNIIYIEPSKNLGGTLDFNRKQARANLQLGYYDTYRTLKGYVGREFCIKPLSEDMTYINELLKTADERIIRAAKIMGYKDINPRRFMFEKLLPLVADYLDMKLNNSYEEIILAFFEEVAITLSLSRDKIYNPREFIDSVKTLFFMEHKSIKSYKRLPGFVLESSLLSGFVKSEFFHFIMDIFFQ